MLAGRRRSARLILARRTSGLEPARNLRQLCYRLIVWLNLHAAQTWDLESSAAFNSATRANCVASSRWFLPGDAICQPDPPASNASDRPGARRPCFAAKPPVKRGRSGRQQALLELTHWGGFL
jgi:hypothetical protein